MTSLEISAFDDFISQDVPYMFSPQDVDHIPNSIYRKGNKFYLLCFGVWEQSGSRGNTLIDVVKIVTNNIVEKRIHYYYNGKRLGKVSLFLCNGEVLINRLNQQFDSVSFDSQMKNILWHLDGSTDRKAYLKAVEEYVSG